MAVPATRLEIKPERGSKAWRVWPDPEPIPAGAIQEARTHVFELTALGAERAELLIDYTPLEPLRSEINRARWKWSLGFNAGVVEAEVRLPGQTPQRFEITTDPELKKLTRADFDAMVREILEDTFALFSLSAFRKGVARGTGNRPPAIARLEFLRSRIADIEEVVRLIARCPRRILTAVDVGTPYYRATRATGPEILRSFKGGRIARETSAQTKLPPQLKGFLPEKIRLRERRSSLDISEHREMKACLRSWAAWLLVVADLLLRQGNNEEHTGQGHLWSARCRTLARRLQRLTLETPLMEAGEALPRLQLSALFRRDPNYRRFYRIWQDINAGIAGVFGDYINLPLARTFELYELWCYLRLLRAAAQIFGEEKVRCGELFRLQPDGGLLISAGAAAVDIGGDWLLYFQKQYREYWIEPEGHGSFSRIMIPDIVAQRRAAGEAARIIVLDAKYRMELGLNDALSSIHMYRDALVRETDAGHPEGIVTAAYLLAPYVPELSVSYRATRMPGRLFHPDYRAGFRFGALTMRPGMPLSSVVLVMEAAIADATSE